ncbi:hypothetical protein [Paenibacillus pabuli]|uniref:hypothetical protein n=1 Tax=Paenibacillus pabuli TaxID=1472 RepID=UPI001FFFAE1F|nr:hypothetical protein [Paenibacillus pabuli]UPK45874.1 hypothetical protein KET34_10655 [Paenibacillus pabuli]
MKKALQYTILVFIVLAAISSIILSSMYYVQRIKYYHNSNELISEMKQTDKEHARLNTEYGKDLDERKKLTEEYRDFLKGIGATE